MYAEYLATVLGVGVDSVVVVVVVVEVVVLVMVVHLQRLSVIVVG